MRYISTRGGTEPVGFADAVMMGMARDGGLLLPESIPDVRGELAAWSRLGYVDLAEAVMRLFTDLPPGVLRGMVQESYASFRHPEVTPVVEVGPVHILELFHGPTLAFKDVALQFLGRVFEHILAARDTELNILAATSGDTGSAAIHGVRGRDRLRIFVMHPHNRVSPLQARQMTAVLDANVFNLAVEGTFDDCQAIMKTCFADLAFKDRYRLGTVNSINWARLLAQVVYYFYAAFRVMERTGAARVRFSVPTGNFGDIFAGWLAARMGLPVGRLVLATNENDILYRFFHGGDYSRGEVQPTLSPSMDIQVASNFERYLYYRLGGDPRQLRAAMEGFARAGALALDAAEPDDGLIAAGRGDTEATLATIRDYAARHRYTLDPHTAVGVHAAGAHLDPREPMICLATAHPAKFPDAIRRATGEPAVRHPLLDALESLPTRCDVIGADADAVRAYVAKRIDASHA